MEEYDKKEIRELKDETYVDALNTALDSILLQSNIILTLDPDPEITEKDKEIMFDKCNNIIDMALAKLQEAKTKFLDS